MYILSFTFLEHFAIFTVKSKVLYFEGVTYIPL